MPGKVLVADDEPLTAEMLALMLSFRGYEVVCARDGAEALETALEVKPDLILMDVMMPGLEGDLVTRALRSDPGLDSCPVVLFSCADETEVDWRDAGADVFLQKPIDIVKLPDIVGWLLGDDEPPPGARRYWNGRRAA